MICSGCGRHAEQLVLCPGCRGVAFCSSACQGESWKLHRLHCGQDMGLRMAASLAADAAAGRPLPTETAERRIVLLRPGQAVCACNLANDPLCMLRTVYEALLVEGGARRCCRKQCSAADVVMPTASLFIVPCTKAPLSHAVVAWFCSGRCKERQMRALNGIERTASQLRTRR